MSNTKEFDLTIPFHSSFGAISFRQVRITAPGDTNEEDVKAELEKKRDSLSFCEMLEMAAELEVSGDQGQAEDKEFEAFLQEVCNKNGWEGTEIHDIPTLEELEKL